MILKINRANKEHIWVKFVKEGKNGWLEGKLLNDSAIDSKKWGDTIKFRRNKIVERKRG